VRLIAFIVFPPLAAAQELGYLAEEGLDLSVEITPSSTELMEGIARGRWDVALSLFDNLLACTMRYGVQMVAFAVTDIRNLSFYARPEIADYAALRGRRIAADAVDTAVALVLRKLLLAHGLDYARGDYELEAVGGQPQRLESMLRGETYAAMLGPPESAAAAAAGFRRLGHHSEVLPDYPGSTIAARASWLAEPANRDAVVRLLRAWQRGAAWATEPANREAAIALVQRAQQASREGAIALLDAVATDIRPNPAGFAGVRDLRVELGLIPPPGPDVEPYYDLSLVREAS